MDDKLKIDLSGVGKPVQRFAIAAFGLLAVVIVIVILAETTAGDAQAPQPQLDPKVEAPIAISDPQQITEILNGTAAAAAQADAAYKKAMTVFGSAGRAKTLDAAAQQLSASSMSIAAAVADIQGLHHKTRTIANKDAREHMEFGMLRIYQVYEEKQSFVVDAATAMRIGTIDAIEAVAQKHAVPIKEIQAKAIDAMVAFAGAKSTLGMPPELTEFK